MRRSIPYLAFFLSGASSLIFQSIWARYLHHVFGTTSVALSSVLSVFMAGLGLGAWLFGKYADRIKHPIVTYAVAEIGVGLCGLVIPSLVHADGWLASVNAALRASYGEHSMTFFLVRFLCIVPILIVPTTLMGSTLPLLAKHFVEAEQSADTASSRVGVLYAVNTFGAVAGTFLASFVLMPSIGRDMTNVVAVSFNFLLAALIFVFLKQLLADTGWKRGDKIEFLPKRAVPAATDDAAAASTAGDTRDDGTRPIPNIVRILAVVTFAVSGAASLCYEVVWSRALAMTIGSSIYSFGLILMTFLIGIAGGSAAMSGFMGDSKRPLVGVALASAVLCFLGNASLGVERGAVPWAALSAGGCALIVTLYVIAEMRARTRAVFNAESTGSTELAAAAPAERDTLFAISMLAVPASMAVLNALIFSDQYLPKIAASVVCAVCLFLGLGITLRRYMVLLLAVLQLFIAAATFLSYLWQDEIPLAFAKLVTTIDDRSLADSVGTVQFFMFLTAVLCTLPPTLGMGAMFPVTIRIWTSTARNIARAVSVVYTSNTIGSIVGAWLPGFVLMPAFGLERTLHFGIWANMLLALVMLISTAVEDPSKAAETPAAEPTAKRGKRTPVTAAKSTPGALPAWHSVVVYILAPLIPALATGLYIGTRAPDSFLRWDLSRMTLGVFRVSLARDVLNPETWGQPDLVYYHDGLTTTVTVERWGRHYALKNNGKVDASNGDDMPTQIMVAGYPLTMHSKGPQGLDVAVVGFGSGVTVGTTLKFPVRSVEVIELERSIPQASQSFRDVNHLNYELPEFPYVQMPRLKVINDDGRNYLASSPKTYDVIISEPSNPWITGVSDLFTVDHFNIAKRRLRPGGIYCQWVQLYEMSPENIKTIYRTFASQFRHVIAFSAEDMSSDTVLLGSDSPLPLDLARLRRAFALPGVAAELERAYIHSPFDIFSRVILASRGEIMAFTQLEYRRKDGGWELDSQSTNAESCTAGSCRREPAILNTDDNARVEFAAPKDLIGFQRYEGYLATIYSPIWPYGRLARFIRGFGTGPEGARAYAELALSLTAHGRKREAAEFINLSRNAGDARETLVALEVLSHLMSDENEPGIHVEPPVPGPQMDARTARRLTEGFDHVQQAVNQGAFAAALVAMEEIESPIRLHSGPGMRFLYGYLLYKGAAGNSSQYRAAIEAFEDLVRDDESYVERHPELYYFLARAHDGDFNFDKAVRNMRIYIETRLAAEAGGADALPEPERAASPVTDAPGETPKAQHADRT